MSSMWLLIDASVRACVRVQACVHAYVNVSLFVLGVLICPCTAHLDICPAFSLLSWLNGQRVDVEVSVVIGWWALKAKSVTRTAIIIPK